MKTFRIILLSISLAGILSTACDELLADLLKFNTQWYEIDFPIEPDQIGDVVFKTDEFTVNVDSVLEANNVTRDRISSIRISDAKVTILTPGQNFDPLDRLELTLDAEGLEAKVVAWVDSIPAGDTIVELELSKEDLQEYLLLSEFKVSAGGQLNSRVEKTVDMRGQFRWIIGGKITE